MTKQDERMRQRKRLVERAIELAAGAHWNEAIDTNVRLLEFGADAETYNRLGKAYFELGQYDRALEYYQETLRINPSNTVARRNVERLEHLRELGGGAVRTKPRAHTDPQIFIIETGKTALTTLTNLADPAVIMGLVIGEMVEISVQGRDVVLKDAEGVTIGQLEPQLAQRLIDLIRGGNQYAAVIANLDAGTVKVLIREVYQDPGQRHLVAFPGRLGGDIAHFRTYARDTAAHVDLEMEELQEDEELIEEEPGDEGEEDFFRGGSEEEEVGLEVIEADITTDEEEEEA